MTGQERAAPRTILELIPLAPNITGNRARQPFILTRLRLAMLAAALATALPARAQQAGNGFLFRQPRVSLAIRGGLDHPTTGGDLFSFMKDELTLDRGAFNAPSLAADVAVWLTPRIDLMLGAAVTNPSTLSEFRGFVDQDDRPIEQSNSLRRIPITVGVKAYLTPRGRTIGQVAWIPARLAPYIGIGGGAMWYRFQQEGDFIDFKTNAVFSDKFSSSAWTGVGQGVAGFDYSLNPRFMLTGEGRYLSAKAKPGYDFLGFDQIDLSGFSVTGGIAVRF